MQPAQLAPTSQTPPNLSGRILLETGPSSVTERDAFAGPKSCSAGASTGQHSRGALEHLASQMRQPGAALPGESLPPGIAPYPLKHTNESLYREPTKWNKSRLALQFVPQPAPSNSRVSRVEMTSVQPRFEPLLRKFKNSCTSRKAKAPTGRPRDALDTQNSSQRRRQHQCAGCTRCNLRCALLWCSFSSFRASCPAPRTRLPTASPAALPPPWGTPAQEDDVNVCRVAGGCEGGGGRRMCMGRCGTQS